ncbi:MAG: hypothetical protein GY937_25575 [bacterium]|nr:hypothetical protein [bacterium]
MANKLPTTASEVAECIQDAAKAQERLELDGLVARAGMLRARRNALARAAKQRPERAARHRAHLAAVSATIGEADGRVMARAVEIKSRPASSKGFALWGRTVDDRGAAVPCTTVAVLGRKDEVDAWTASDVGGWYALAVDDAEAAALVQVSDERGTVISKGSLKGVGPGARLRRDFTVPAAKTKGTAPPQSKGGPTEVAEPVGVSLKREKELAARRAELVKVRDARAEAVEKLQSAVDALDEREAELKAAKAEAAASVKKVRRKVSRNRTSLRRIDAEMDGYESKRSTKYEALSKRRGASAAKLEALERELDQAVAHEGGLAEAGANLAAEREAAEAALDRAKAELTALGTDAG